MSFITTDDNVQIFYKDWGPKNAQPIVFHHGWPLSSDDWDAQILFFLLKPFRVVAHDRRGYGRSQQIDEGHDIEDYASDAFSIVRALDPRDAVHIGRHGRCRARCWGRLPVRQSLWQVTGIGVRQG